MVSAGVAYASKDFYDPVKERRINWGWALVPPASTQTLPREVTFNAAARTLQQYPIDELKALLEYLDVTFDPDLEDKERLVALVINQKNLVPVAENLKEKFKGNFVPIFGFNFRDFKGRN